jgi:hypothetical protein
MALTQTQIIRSLADALAWYEKELEWGVAPGELNHLTGRIGELYAAMITRGQMALQTNERGYDVVSADNERISVKTITSTTNVRFNANTFHLVDRVMVLRINVDDDEGISIESLWDKSAAEARAEIGDRLVFYPNSRTQRERKPIENLRVVDQASYGEVTIKQYENATILVFRAGIQVPVAKPVLREIAAKIGVDIMRSNGEQKDTRQIGAGVIKMLKAIKLGDRLTIDVNP